MKLSKVFTWVLSSRFQILGTQRTDSRIRAVQVKLLHLLLTFQVVLRSEHFSLRFLLVNSLGREQILAFIHLFSQRGGTRAGQKSFLRYNPVALVKPSFKRQHGLVSQEMHRRRKQTGRHTS